jgi:N-acyl homoserine lactone hydrolase
MTLNHPTVDLLLDGFSLGSDQGHIAFCEVILVQGVDAEGIPRRLIYDLGHAGRRELLWAGLRARGLTPADVDIAVLSHSHWDHIQNIDVFENAQTLIHPIERRYLRDPHPSDFGTPRYTSSIIERQDVREVEEGAEVLRGVRVVELPGHSPCVLGLLIETASERILLASDAIQSADVAVSGQNRLVFWNVRQADESVRRARRLADVIYPGHDQPFRLSTELKPEYIRSATPTLTGVNPVEPLPVASVPSERYVMPGIESQRLPRRA